LKLLLLVLFHDGTALLLGIFDTIFRASSWLSKLWKFVLVDGGENNLSSNGDDSVLWLIIVDFVKFILFVLFSKLLDYNEWKSLNSGLSAGVFVIEKQIQKLIDLILEMNLMFLCYFCLREKFYFRRRRNLVHHRHALSLDILSRRQILTYRVLLT